ncbi:MAG: RdgB/HAM1 family non-canonical purine NTP pyrophosphatase [Planctomycetaceae bacterium]|jgi:XTP/dITP diphosphohydrolase|nr:RdgB/HAM1 family non-canonical purine NTP pyrophosphatase [Planctomycetaceae bacterium]
MTQKILIFGTSNRKKVEETSDLFAKIGITLKSLADFPQGIEVVEDGASFAENAAKKASEQAAFFRTPVMAEDSGLVVDALNGAPGIYSSRFSGENATDASNNALLLEKLSNVPLEQRTAHYVCHIAIAAPSGKILAETEGICRGRIRFEPDGNAGFGYDPLFEVVEYHQTFGRLAPIMKQAISHRSRAARQILQILSGGLSLDKTA